MLPCRKKKKRKNQQKTPFFDVSIALGLFDVVDKNSTMYKLQVKEKKN